MKRPTLHILIYHGEEGNGILDEIGARQPEGIYVRARFR